MFEQSAAPSTPCRARRRRVDRGGPARGGRRERVCDGRDGGRPRAAAAAGVGRRAGLRLPRRRHQRPRRRVRQGRRPPAVRPGAARGDVGVRRRSATRSSPARSASAWRRPGPGAIHLLNGLYDAKLDHVPVVAIVGQTERSAMGGAYQQEVDLQALFKDVASDYLVEVNVPEQLPNAIDRAFRTAHDPPRARPRSSSRATCRTEDVLRRRSTRSSRCPSSPPGLRAPTSCPPDGGARARRRGAQRRAEGRDPGRPGRPRRGREVEQVADVLGAGVAKALLGKDVLSDELPFVTGSIGLLGTRPSYEMMRDCDTLLIVGSNFPYSQFLPEFGQARAVQIDLDGTLIGMRYPTEVNLVGDAQATLRGAAAARCPARPTGRGGRRSRRTSPPGGTRWSAQAHARRGAGQPDADRLGALAAPPGQRDRHRRLRLRRPTGTPATCGCAATSAARSPGTLATMGAGGAVRDRRQVRPPRPAGDRAHRRRRHADERHGRAADDRPLRATAGPTRGADRCVLHNNDLNQVTWELRAMGGAPKFEESQVLPDVSYADFARGIGLTAITVTSPDELGPAWDRGAGRRPARGARRALRPRGAADPAARRRSTRSSR